MAEDAALQRQKAEVHLFGRGAERLAVRRRVASGTAFRSLHLHQTFSVLKDGACIRKEEGGSRFIPSAFCLLPSALCLKGEAWSEQ